MLKIILEDLAVGFAEAKYVLRLCRSIDGNPARFD